MTDLVAFLRARLDEDEAAAQAVPEADWLAQIDEASMNPDGAVELYVRRMAPARVLAEVAAKRAIITLLTELMEHLPESPKYLRVESLRPIELLAQPYADHPDFDLTWATPAQ